MPAGREQKGSERSQAKAAGDERELAGKAPGRVAARQTTGGVATERAVVPDRRRVIQTACDEARKRFNDFAECLDEPTQAAAIEAIVMALTAAGGSAGTMESMGQEVKDAASLLGDLTSDPNVGQLVLLVARHLWCQMEADNPYRGGVHPGAKLLLAAEEVNRDLSRLLLHASPPGSAAASDARAAALKEVLIVGVFPDSELYRRCEELGLGAKKRFRLAVAFTEADIARPKRGSLRSNEALAALDALCIEMDGEPPHIAVVGTAEEWPSPLAMTFDDGYGWTLLTSSAADRLDSLAESYQRLRALLPHALRLEGGRAVVREAELAPTALLETAGKLQRQRYLSSVFGELLHEPEHRRRPLLDTLRVLSEKRGGLAAAAVQLNAHAKTLQYRMGRLGAITGLDPYTPSDRFRLQLALQILDAPVGGDGRE